jgi:apolipoprotein N-acyltransferase
VNSLKAVVAWIEAARGWRRRGLALLFGVLAAAALPPFHALPLLWIAFPGLIWLLDGAKRGKEAFFVGWWYGFGHFSVGVYWIAHALLVDPLRFGWMVPFAVFGLGGILAVFVGAATFAARRVSPAGVPRVLTLAVTWVLFEWVRSWIFTGFPWNLIGSVWMPVLPVVQFAAIAGTYGLGLLTVVVAAMPAVLAHPVRGDRLAMAASLLILAAVALWGGLRLSDGPTTFVPDVRLRLVQANIEQTLKWDPELRIAHFQRHLDLTASPGWDKVTDVIWSETAAPSFLERDETARRLMASVTPPGGLLITGAVRGTGAGISPFRIWNSLIALNGRGDIVGTYDKAHLVPFGEYMPLHGLIPLSKITAGSVDFSAGLGAETIVLPGLPPVGPLICYEVIFPGEVVDRAHRPAWLLNLTNDGWYGISAGPYQHFASARLRAVEEGLPLVRAANTGISGVVDPYGRIIAELPLGMQGVVDAGLPTALPASLPFAKFGILAPLLSLVLVLLSAAIWAKIFRQG